MAIGIRGLALKNHFAPFEHGTFGNQYGGVAAGVLIAVVDQKLGEALDIESVLGDNATVGGAGHGGEHRGVTGVAAENFDDHETLMRARGGAEVIDKL